MVPPRIFKVHSPASWHEPAKSMARQLLNAVGVAGSYDLMLVALSMLVGTGASFAALDSTSRATASTGQARGWWLFCGGLSLGLGVWSVQYIGMMAFRLPVPVLFDLPAVLQSLVVAVLAGWLGLIILNSGAFPWTRWVFGGAVMVGLVYWFVYVRTAKPKRS